MKLIRFYWSKHLWQRFLWGLFALIISTEQDEEQYRQWLRSQGEDCC